MAKRKKLAAVSHNTKIAAKTVGQQTHSPQDRRHQSSQPSLPPSSIGMNLKLAPIHGAIHARNYKAALKLITTNIEKYGEQPVLLALQALCFQRIGQSNKSLQICQHIVQIIDVHDEKAMTPLLLTCKFLDAYDLLSQLWADAQIKEPQNEQFALRYFYSIVHEYDFVKQQKTAMSLYKKFNKKQYLNWAVVNLEFQIQEEGPNQLSSLAEMMLRRSFADNPPTIIEPVLMLIRILNKQFKYNEALDVIKNLVQPMCKGDDQKWKILIADTELKRENWKVVSSIYKDLLEHNSIISIEWDWYHVLGYFNSHFLLSEQEKIDLKDTYKASSSFLDSICGDNKKNPSRTYLTSHLELITQICLRDIYKISVSKNINILRSNTKDLISENYDTINEIKNNLKETDSFYFESLINFLSMHYQFCGDKPSYILDIGHYIQILPSSAMKKFFLRLHNIHKELLKNSLMHPFKIFQENDFIFCDGNMWERFTKILSKEIDIQSCTTSNNHLVDAIIDINFYKAQRIGNLWKDLTKKEYFILVSELIMKYNICRNTIPILENEMHVSDDYLILTVYALMESFWMTVEENIEKPITTKMSKLSISESDPTISLNMLISTPITDSYIENINNEFNSFQILFTVVCLLEYGLCISPTHPQFKLLLIRLYSHPSVSSFLRASDIFTSAEIKHVLIESLSHVLINDAYRNGHLAEAVNYCSNFLAFHYKHKTDSSEIFKSVYQYDNYTKVREIVEFSKRLQKSHQLALVESEITFYKICSDDIFDAQTWTELLNKHIKKSNTNKIEDLIYNEDFSAVYTWSQIPSIDVYYNRCQPSVFPAYDLPNKMHSHAYLNKQSNLFIEFRRKFEEHLYYCIQINSKEARTNYSTLEKIMTDIFFVNLNNGEKDKNFNYLIWKISLMIFQIGTNICEGVSESNEDFFTTLNNDSDLFVKTEEIDYILSKPLKIHLNKWNTIIDSFNQINELTNRICIMANEMCKQLLSQDDNRLNGFPVTSGRILPDSTVLHPLNLFATHYLFYLTIYLQLWLYCIPTRKVLSKIRKKAKLPSKASVLEMKVFETFHQTREQLRLLTNTIYTHLSDIMKTILTTSNALSELSNCVVSNFNNIDAITSMSISAVLNEKEKEKKPDTFNKIKNSSSSEIFMKAETFVYDSLVKNAYQASIQIKDMITNHFKIIQHLKA